MKTNLLLLLMFLLSFLATDAEAREWCADDLLCCEDSCCENEKIFYAKILGGGNFLQKTEIAGNEATYQPGYFIAGSLGACWHYGLRLEAEYTFRRNAINNIDFFVEGSSDHGYYQASSYMGNLLWDLPLSSWGCSFRNIQPFIGAGIGYDFQRMHSSNSRIVFDQKWHHLSWQLMGGLIYPIFGNIDMALEYRFHRGNSHFYNHSFGVALAYKFGCFR